MIDVLRRPEDISPAWLTTALRRVGRLPRGQVSELQAIAGATNTATAVRLAVRYSPDAPAETPGQLFVKLGAARHEVAFYTHVAPALASPPVIPCYDARAEPADDQPLAARGHLLLPDLSASHRELPATAAPIRAQARAIVDCLAEVHAAWWQHPRLAGDVGALAAQEPILDFVSQQARANFPAFVAYLGDRLTPAQRRLMADVVDGWPLPGRAARLAAGKAVTLLHGDAHAWNFLLPRDRARTDVYLADWRAWHIGVGTGDLAYLMGLHWSPAQRAARERRLLRRYHRGLLARGVAGYSWAACQADYRLSLREALIWPVFHWWTGSSAAIWADNLAHILRANEAL